MAEKETRSDAFKAKDLRAQRERGDSKLKGHRERRRMSWVDYYLENCECYFWRRQLASAIICIITGVISFFVIGVLDDRFVVCLIGAICLGGATGAVYWVLTSESYCPSINPCIKREEFSIHPDAY